MAEHIKINDRLTSADHDGAIRETYLGQAHIAGTGPNGKTCRECAHWYVEKYNPFEERHVASHPGYYGPTHTTRPLEAKNARCNRPILNKANKRIPHHARACRLFQQAENPLPAKRDPGTRGRDN